MTPLTFHLSQLTQAPTADALCELHCRKMAEYRFDRNLHGFSDFTSKLSPRDQADFVLLYKHYPA